MQRRSRSKVPQVPRQASNVHATAVSKSSASTSAATAPVTSGSRIPSLSITPGSTIAPPRLNTAAPYGNMAGMLRLARSRSVVFQGREEIEPDEDWLSMFLALLEYKTECYANLTPEVWFDPPSSYKESNESRTRKQRRERLAAWVEEQREIRLASYTSGEEEMAILAKIEKMNSIHFVWSVGQLPPPLSDQDWEEHFLDLREYVKKRGDAIVPPLTDLGIWCSDQRRRFQMNSMSPTEIDALIAIGFDFDKESPDWNAMFFKLFLYQMKHGDCIVPNPDFRGSVKSYKIDNESDDDGGFDELRETSSDEEHQFLVWAQHQRIEYKVFKEEHDDSTSMPETFEALEHIGFQWETQGGLDKFFVESFRRLKEFKERNALDSISRETHEKGIQQFIRCTRDAMRKKNDFEVEGKEWTSHWTTPTKVKLLDSICFEWEPPLPFDEMMALLLKFKTKHGHCNVNQSHTRLGVFVSRVRGYYRDMKQGKPAGPLTEERVKELDEMGFVWEPKTLPKDPAPKPKSKGIEKKRKKSDNSDPIPIESMIGYELEIGRPKGKHISWEERFDCLKRYKAKHDDCMVPQCQPGIGIWVKTLRIQYERRLEGKPAPQLNEERIKKLEEIGFVWRVRGKRSNYGKKQKKRQDTDLEQDEEESTEPSKKQRVEEEGISNGKKKSDEGQERPIQNVNRNTDKPAPLKSKHDSEDKASTVPVVDEAEAHTKPPTDSKAESNPELHARTAHAHSLIEHHVPTEDRMNMPVTDSRLGHLSHLLQPHLQYSRSGDLSGTDEPSNGVVPATAASAATAARNFSLEQELFLKYIQRQHSEAQSTVAGAAIVPSVSSQNAHLRGQQRTFWPMGYPYHGRGGPFGGGLM